jgi:hypothetical protein
MNTVPFLKKDLINVGDKSTSGMTMNRVHNFQTRWLIASPATIVILIAQNQLFLV